MLVFQPGEKVIVKPQYATKNTGGAWVVDKFLSKNYELSQFVGVNPKPRKLRAKPWQIQRVADAGITGTAPQPHVTVVPYQPPLGEGVIVTVDDPSGKIRSELYVIHRDNTFKNNTVELSQLGGGKAWKNVPRSWLTVIPLDKLRATLCG